MQLMVLIFLTAIPMSIINSNVFLFLIAIFSFYLAFSGMRFARNRSGVPTRIDLIAVNFMFLSGAGMWILAIIFFIGHILIAMTVVSMITGASIWEAGAVAIIEPAVNSVWFYILHKIWNRYKS